MQARKPSAAPPIVVTGGTGTLGRLVVARLRHEGRSVRTLSRGKRSDVGRQPGPNERIEHVTADLATGEGVDTALTGAEIVIHCAGTAKGDGDKARHLLRAASAAGVRHLVFISVVGADRIPMAGAIDRAMFGYFGAKLDAELAVAGSSVPWTTLRATQFFDLTLSTAQGLSQLPVIPVPSGFRFQPIDASEVADRLVALALGAPSGLVPAIGGPRIYEMAALVRSYLEAVGKRRAIVSMPVPGKAASAIRAGANLAPDRAVGRRTWEEFLADRVGRGPEPAAATA
jgi:uncharacterized protein YbjT (DUF2867 family)